MRTRCSVLGCKATSGRFTIWICSRHWKLITKAERRVWNRIKRLAKRYGWETVDERGGRVWDALVRRAGNA